MLKATVWLLRMLYSFRLNLFVGGGGASLTKLIPLVLTLYSLGYFKVITSFSIFRQF